MTKILVHNKKYNTAKIYVSLKGPKEGQVDEMAGEV